MTSVNRHEDDEPAPGQPRWVVGIGSVGGTWGHGGGAHGRGRWLVPVAAAGRALGCDTAQGYLLGRPMAAPDLERWLNEDAKGTPAGVR
jgi:hypothetical protein